MAPGPLFENTEFEPWQSHQYWDALKWPGDCWNYYRCFRTSKQSFCQRTFSASYFHKSVHPTWPNQQIDSASDVISLLFNKACWSSCVDLAGFPGCLLCESCVCFQGGVAPPLLPGAPPPPWMPVCKWTLARRPARANVCLPVLQLGPRSHTNKLAGCWQFIPYLMHSILEEPNHLQTEAMYRDHFVHAPSQWEMTLQYNVVSHWLGAFTKWSLTVAGNKSPLTGLITWVLTSPHWSLQLEWMD